MCFTANEFNLFLFKKVLKRVQSYIIHNYGFELKMKKMANTSSTPYTNMQKIRLTPFKVGWSSFVQEH